MSAPLLLDTCAAIWTVEDRLLPAAVEMLTRRYQAGEPTFVSPITAWELGLLHSKGRLRLPVAPREYFHRLLHLPHVKLAELTPEILLASSYLPGMPPRDPADRIMAATARENDFTLMTRDARLLAYGEEGHLRTVRC